MKERFVIDLRPGDEIMEFFMLRAISLKVGSNGKQYLDFVLTDASGDLSCKKWDVDDVEAEFLKQLQPGDLVRVKGSVTDWKGQTQLRVTRIRKAEDKDGLQLRDFIKTAPEDSEAMYDYLLGVIASIRDEDFRWLCEYLYQSNREQLLYYPAAMSNHHAEYGGLLYHVKRMTMAAERACEVYPLLSRDLLLTGVLIHDIEKLSEILSDSNGISPGYSFRGQLLGHIVQGVSLIDALCREHGIDEEKTTLLEHMILSHHYEPEFGSPKKPLFPEAEMLHYLDIVDARMFDMEEALKGVDPGSFSDRVWPLENRRLYKKSF